MLVESINKTENNVVKWIKLLILVVLCHIKNELMKIKRDRQNRNSACIIHWIYLFFSFHYYEFLFQFGNLS